MKALSWLWPDRTIGKRESRRLREEHNALVNDYDTAVKALESCLAWMEFTIPKLPKLGDKCPKCNEPASIHSMNWGGPVSKARNAIARSEGKELDYGLSEQKGGAQ